MKKILKSILIVFSSCIGLGFIVSKLEKKRGWVEGHKPYGSYEKHFKRPLDFGIALFALLLLWPVLLTVAIAVRLKLGSPVLFTQERPGLGGETFRLRKFRTMTMDRDEAGELLSDELRLIPFSKTLRSLSLDARVIIRQTTESTVITAFREVSPKPFYWGRDLSSDALINKREYDTLALIA